MVCASARRAEGSGSIPLGHTGELMTNIDLEKENTNLKFQIEKLKFRNQFLESLYETARSDWTKYGSETALKQMVFNLRTRKINTIMEP